MGPGELISLDEAARRAGLRPRTVREWRWRASRSLPLPEHAIAFLALLRKPGGRLLVDAAGLGRWLGSGRRRPASRTENSELLEQALALDQLASDFERAGDDRRAVAVLAAARLLHLASEIDGAKP